MKKLAIGKARHKKAAIVPNVEELVKRLGKPLPREVLKNLSNGLSSYAVTHVYDRLNHVLGVTGWSRTPKITSVEQNGECDERTGLRLWSATCEIRVDLPALGKNVFRIGHGGYKNVDRGDAEKGAVSDAAKNALKDLIGKEIHMGAYDIPPDESEGKPFRLKKDGPPKNGTTETVFTDCTGIITEILEGAKCAWVQIDGWTCKAEGRHAEWFTSDKVLHLCEGNAKWANPDGKEWIKIVTGIMGVTRIPAMRIPDSQ